MSIDSRNTDPQAVVSALAAAGTSAELRTRWFEDLRQQELASSDPAKFREQVRWPIISALLDKAQSHQVTLESGLKFEVTVDSRIERALLLSAQAKPDHVWEPQTTRLLVGLGTGPRDVVIGGAYIGDQVLPLAHSLRANGFKSKVHAFEPMSVKFRQLNRNIELNNASNVVPHHQAVWDKSGETLGLTGAPALANCGPLEGSSEQVTSVAIDDYVQRSGIDVGLIMVDLEGGEERALRGAKTTLVAQGPNVVFEVHRDFVDWSIGLEKTSLIRFMTECGYKVFAVRDYNDNISMKGHAIEIIPVDSIYLEGPPHGFNMLAVKDEATLSRLGLRVVKNVSPKLLLNRDPKLHQPLD